MPRQPTLSIDVLSSLINYDKSSGSLTWRARTDEFCSPQHCARWNKRWAGKPALNAETSRGYFMGRIFDVPYKAHRVVWALHYGSWPSGSIDHIDGNPKNNIISNLRDVGHRLNMRNVRPHRDAILGVKGVYLDKKNHRYCARIMIDGKQKWLGGFKNIEEAAEAYRSASLLLHQEYGRTS